MTRGDSSESQRLESLWSGEFGDAYVERNLGAARHRRRFWTAILREFPAEHVLEIGCNVGGNLTCIAGLAPSIHAVGVDVNAKALERLRVTSPAVGIARAVARDLPFPDSRFDLTFTIGLLIHQPAESLSQVMSEVVRCSRRFILCGEYYAAEPAEIPYRGQGGALFKRDYGRLYEGLFLDLRLRKRGFLSRADGFDDVDYWVFEKC